MRFTEIKQAPFDHHAQSAQGSSTPMTQDAASRIQSSEAKSGDGGVKSGSFASRAQSAAANNANKSGGGGGKGGGGKGGKK